MRETGAGAVVSRTARTEHRPPCFREGNMFCQQAAVGKSFGIQGAALCGALAAPELAEVDGFTPPPLEVRAAKSGRMAPKGSLAHGTHWVSERRAGMRAESEVGEVRPYVFGRAGERASSFEWSWADSNGVDEAKSLHLYASDGIIPGDAI